MPSDEYVMFWIAGKVQLPDTQLVWSRDESRTVSGFDIAASTEFLVAGWTSAVTISVLANASVMWSASGMEKPIGTVEMAPGMIRLHRVVLTACCANGPMANDTIDVKAATKAMFLVAVMSVLLTN